MEDNIRVDVYIHVVDGKGGASADDLTITGALLYLFGFIGMGIMLFSIPSYMLVFGLLALLIYSLPLLAVVLAVVLRPFLGIPRDEFIDELLDDPDEKITASLCRALYGGGSIIKNVLKNFLAPYAYVLFNLFLAAFWICYPIGSIKETTLIGIIFASAYSMYYFPFILFKAAKRHHSKLLGIATVGIIVTSLALFLVNYDTFMETDSVVGIAFFFTMITVLGTLAILISNLFLAKSKKTKIALLALYLVLVIAVGCVSVFALPNQNEDKYNEAIACVQSGDYRRARELFSALGRYEDAEQRYNEIKFKDLQVGEKVVMGSQANKPDSLQGDNPLSWTVIAVNDGKALLLSDAILTSIDSNPLSRWESGNNVRGKLRDLEYLFSDTDKARIAEYTYTIKIDGEDVQVTDKLFLLSQSELQQYCQDDQIFSKKDTKYNDHQVLGYLMQDSDYEYVYSYYVRNTNDSGEWIIADCQAKQFVIKNNRYVGVRPAMYVSMDESK